MSRPYFARGPGELSLGTRPDRRRVDMPTTKPVSYYASSQPLQGAEEAKRSEYNRGPGIDMGRRGRV
jgi:hypothetical protein